MASAVHVSAFQKGDHICLFYRDIDEQMSTLAPFVRVGLERNERCFLVLPADQADHLISDLHALGIDTAGERERGALILLQPEEIYTCDGGFDRARMIGALHEAVAEALQMGFSGFRAAGDMGWAAEQIGGCVELPEYEATMEKFYPQQPALGLCMYDTRRFGSDELRDLMDEHRFALTTPSPSTRAIRVRKGSLIADIVFDRHAPSLFHYKVQRESSPELLSVGQESSLNGALGTVKSMLRFYPK